MRPPSPLIRMEAVSKTYITNSGDPVQALGRVDLAITEGDFVCIVGPSGCGKSTLLRLLGGLDAPSSGQTILAGRTIDGPSSDVGIVFQNATLLPWLTIVDNVRLPLRVGRARGAAPTKVADLLLTAGLSGFENKYPYELSGGMQQRAAICRALVRDPKVLLMDEPFGALDALTRERMNVELQRIWQASRKTVVLITHSVAEAVFLGDRVVVMSQRPARILEDFHIPLPRPRSFSDTPARPEYAELARAIRATLDTTAEEVVS